MNEKVYIFKYIIVYTDNVMNVNSTFILEKNIPVLMKNFIYLYTYQILHSHYKKIYSLIIKNPRIREKFIRIFIEKSYIFTYTFINLTVY